MLAIILATQLLALLFNGLLYPEMAYVAAALQHAGIKTVTYWHDSEPVNVCPAIIIGHSMGGNAALNQGAYCQARGKAPKIIIAIDSARIAAVCPKGLFCISYFNPAHPIGGQFVTGAAHNYIVTGYSHLNMPAAVASRVLAQVKTATK